MVSITTWPPPSPATESQQPLSSPNPPKPLPVKSDSSHAMKMTELPVQAFEFVIALTVFNRKESPAAISACTWEKSHGSSEVEARPCMSLHWSGLIQVKSATLPLARSVANWLKSTILATRAGLLCTSWYEMKGLCLR